MRTIALTGGGTAGHIMPNLALTDGLRRQFDHIIYIGGSGMEKTIVPEYGLPFFETAVIKLDRSNPFKNAKIPFVLHTAVKEAKEILQKENVNIVFSKGGYAALPACLAARSLKIPVIQHESDYSMGVANKLTARFASRVLTSFPETPGGIFTGNPVRAEILKGNAARARENYHISNRPVILAFGGSLGAEAVNRALTAAAPELTKTHNVFHITGKNKTDLTIPGYYQTEYAKDIPDLFALADAVIIRGGANSLCEAAVLGKRALCIPLPKGASRGDQLDNAVSYQKRGYAAVLPQDKLSPETLVSAMRKLLQSPPPKPLPSDANENILREIMSALPER